jgi:anthranilate synthase component II
MQTEYKIPNVLLLDNHDSFIYNIVHEIAILKCEYTMWKSDECTLQQIEALSPTHIVLGPGPGTPKNAGIMMDAIERFVHRIPILGICLGHQALGVFFGGTLGYAPQVQHGKPSSIHHTNTSLFKGLPNPLQVGRYHSLHVHSLPTVLQILATSEDGCIQAFVHDTLPCFGVQFHPESILSRQAYPIWNRFLEVTARC